MAKINQVIRIKTTQQLYNVWLFIGMVEVMFYVVMYSNGSETAVNWLWGWIVWCFIVLVLAFITKLKK